VKDNKVFVFSSLASWPVMRQRALFDMQPSAIHVNEGHAIGALLNAVSNARALAPGYALRLLLYLSRCNMPGAFQKRQGRFRCTEISSGLIPFSSPNQMLFQRMRLAHVSISALLHSAATAELECS